MTQKPSPHLFVYDDKTKIVILYTNATTPIISLAIAAFGFNYKLITRASIGNEWIMSCPKEGEDLNLISEMIKLRVSEEHMLHLEKNGVLLYVCYQGYQNIERYDATMSELDAAMMALRSQGAYCDMIAESKLAEFMENVVPKRYAGPDKDFFIKRVKKLKDVYKQREEEQKNKNKKTLH